LLLVSDLVVRLPSPRGTVHAVSGVNIAVGAGETVGLIGESGCGKSTLGKTIMRLLPSTAGKIVLDGEDITDLRRSRLRAVRPKVQMIFQDSFGALNPAYTVGRSIGQPLRNAGWNRAATQERVRELLNLVGLPLDAYFRYPTEFSGGQRQRIGIARAIALNPKLLVCDEPVSALDVSVRAQVINLFADMKDKFGISYLFISHDLAVVQHIADRIVVMYLGRVVEEGTRATFWSGASHPYTQALLDAVPQSDPRVAKLTARNVLQGELPSPLNPPSGCGFHTRCPFAEERCRMDVPQLHAAPGGNLVACHRVPEVATSELAPKLSQPLLAAAAQ
jgi:oligopeptide/dipeptide ABC transporter ATP-binding protein